MSTARENAEAALAARFWAKVEKTEGCWIWTATKSAGYGRFWVGGRLVQAHRWSYEALVAAIPDGLLLDHLCRNPSCVNPAHLEPVTNQENTRRGIAGEVIRHRQAQQTHCKRGHEFTPENTRLRGDTMQRKCRACDAMLARERYHAKKDAA